MIIIDFHNHFFPPEYLKAIEEGPSNVVLKYDDNHNPLLYYPGDYNIVVRGHRDIEYRQKVLEEAGIDKQVLSFTTPGTHIETQKRAIELSRRGNDGFAKIKAERGDRFDAFATLPLNDPESSVVEMERAITELGCSGVTLHSNVNGVAISDESFFPV